MFDAIVLSNGWDDATASLQLLSHLEGDALNVALLVPVLLISNPPFTNPNPRIGLESLLEHFIFLNFLGGEPPNTPIPINIHTINFRILDCALDRPKITL